MVKRRILIFTTAIVLGLTLWFGAFGSALGQEISPAVAGESAVAVENTSDSVNASNKNGVDNLGLVALGSIIIAGLTIAVGSIAPALGEGRAVAQALSAIAQQPDSSNTITRTLFVGLAMIESTAIYCFVVSMILLFANPFWNYFIQ
jgi:F-type H+-transporting ATPase subunit c